ncbi:hypothetical protein IFM89_028349 [Coptis chinensis]|uniref:Acyl-CoA thioesterase 2 C-terminal domain-containing protein n=1 Tax=Coptis chinensis TaxID=261450 RepID=A0A835J2L8_9MAGN|nr:hypothetical protein IFM89_028349 [Coptis chinensis]
MEKRKKVGYLMWFHRPFRADEWLLYVMDNPSSSNARGFSLGRIFNRKACYVIKSRGSNEDGENTKSCIHKLLDLALLVYKRNVMHFRVFVVVVVVFFFIGILITMDYLGVLSDVTVGAECHTSFQFQVYMFAEWLSLGTHLENIVVEKCRAVGVRLRSGQSSNSMMSQMAAAGSMKKMFAHCLDGTEGGGIFAMGNVVQPKVNSTPVTPATTDPLPTPNPDSTTTSPFAQVSFTHFQKFNITRGIGSN